MATELGWESPPEFTPEARAALRDHPWPGNVRELKNVVERAVCRAEEDQPVHVIVFDPFAGCGAAATAGARAAASADAAPGKNGASDHRLPVNLPEILAETERRFLQQALTQARFRQREAAALLGLSYDQFRGLYRRHQERGAKESAPGETSAGAA